jgi:hypothetical protein
MANSLGEARDNQENEHNNVSDPNNQQSTSQAALEKVKYEDFSVPTNEAEAQNLLWFEKVSSEINHNLRLKLGEYFYTVNQQFKNKENTQYSTFKQWVKENQETSGFPARSTIFDYIRLYKKEYQLEGEGNGGGDPKTVQVQGLSKESMEFLEQFSTAAKPQKRKDALQKAVNFIKNNPDVQAQFERYVNEPNQPTVDTPADEVNENGGE